MYGNVRGYIMKKTKKTSPKRSAKSKNEEVMTAPEMPVYEQPTMPLKEDHHTSQRKFPSLTTIVTCLLAGIIVGVLFAYQGMPIAATVNGQPIFRWEIANILFQRYGQQTIQGVITERLIASEAQKSGVAVSQSDIDAKAQQILSSFGSNMSVDDFLKFQGMQKQDFDNQIKLQLTVEQLLSKDLKITDDDVTAYIATNQATLTATDPAKLRDEARNAIKDEKISEKVQEWLQELKSKASIKSFL